MAVEVGAMVRMVVVTLEVITLLDVVIKAGVVVVDTPREQFDRLDDAGYHQPIRDRIARGEIQANNADTSVTPSAVPTPPVAPSTAPITQVSVPTLPTPDAPSVLTGFLSTPTAPTSASTPCSSSMAIVTPSPPLRGSTTSTQMDSGPNTLLRQLMSNASTHTSQPPSSTGELMTTNSHGHQYQVHRINQTSHATYRISHQECLEGCTGALVDSVANGGMAGSDTYVLSTVPHAHVDIMGVGGSAMECLPLVQCASEVDTVDEGCIVLNMSQYAHKPDSKTIHSKSQFKHFGGIVHDSALTAGGHQMIVTHEGYTIPLHVQNGLYYGYVFCY